MLQGLVGGPVSLQGYFLSELATIFAIAARPSVFGIIEPL
jgi:hypothetical protein